MAVLTAGVATIISPPVLRPRRWGLLLDAVQPITADRWEGGVTFTPLGCSTLYTQESLFCADDSIPQQFQDPSAGTAGQGHSDADGSNLPVFESFAVLADEHCSALSIDLAWLQNRLDERFRIGISKAVAHELFDATGSLTEQGFSFVATDYGTPLGPATQALADVERGLADVLNGAEGMIHMSPVVFSEIGGNGLFVRDGDLWRTRTGHVVVSDAGYVRQDAIFGSGPVMVAVGPPRRLGADGYGAWDHTRNILQATSMAQAIFAFDPCSVVQGTVTEPVFT